MSEVIEKVATYTVTKCNPFKNPQSDKIIVSQAFDLVTLVISTYKSYY